MILEPKNIILTIFVVVNLIFLCVKKDFLNVVLGLLISFFLIVWFASETIANQRLFYEFSIYFTIFLLVLVGIFTRSSKLNERSDKASGSKIMMINKISFSAIASLCLFVFALFLVNLDVRGGWQSSSGVAKQLDINNTQLAKEKYQSKTAILNETSAFVDVFSALEKVVLLSVFLFCFLLVFSVKKEIFFDKK